MLLDQFTHGKMDPKLIHKLISTEATTLTQVLTMAATEQVPWEGHLHWSPPSTQRRLAIYHERLDDGTDSEEDSMYQTQHNAPWQH